LAGGFGASVYRKLKTLGAVEKKRKPLPGRYLEQGQQNRFSHWKNEEDLNAGGEYLYSYWRLAGERSSGRLSKHLEMGPSHMTGKSQTTGQTSQGGISYKQVKTFKRKRRQESQFNRGNVFLLLSAYFHKLMRKGTRCFSTARKGGKDNSGKKSEFQAWGKAKKKTPAASSNKGGNKGECLTERHLPLKARKPWVRRSQQSARAGRKGGLNKGLARKTHKNSKSMEGDPVGEFARHQRGALRSKCGGRRGGWYGEQVDIC